MRMFSLKDDCKQLAVFQRKYKDYLKHSITAKYALGGLSNNAFASRYVIYMPNKEQLIAQIETVMRK